MAPFPPGSSLASCFFTCPAAVPTRHQRAQVTSRSDPSPQAAVEREERQHDGRHHDADDNDAGPRYRKGWVVRLGFDGSGVCVAWRRKG